MDTCSFKYRLNTCTTIRIVFFNVFLDPRLDDHGCISSSSCVQNAQETRLQMVQSTDISNSLRKVCLVLTSSMCLFIVWQGVPLSPVEADGGVNFRRQEALPRRAQDARVLRRARRASTAGDRHAVVGTRRQVEGG